MLAIFSFKIPFYFLDVIFSIGTHNLVKLEAKNWVNFIFSRYEQMFKGLEGLKNGFYVLKVKNIEERKMLMGLRVFGSTRLNMILRSSSTRILVNHDVIFYLSK